MNMLQEGAPSLAKFHRFQIIIFFVLDAFDFLRSFNSHRSPKPQVSRFTQPHTLGSSL